MARDTNFLELYQALGLAPGCSPEAFRQAYRRRVADLHPDRPDGAADVGELQRLNALYASALEFQRRHGRLPGAPLPSRPAGMGVAGEAPAPAAAAAAEAPASRIGGWLGTVGVLVLLVAVGLGVLIPDPPAPPSAPVPASGASEPEVAAERRIELGTSKEVVRALLGAPLLETDQRWDYGPSWITFRCGTVNGWYSSPLRPLGTPSAHPGANKLPPPRC